jgi:DNA-binding MarR family transcriptional regulator
MDQVGKILEQWRSERPDLDTQPMGLFGRLARLRNHLAREIDGTLSTFGLHGPSFDVLAALRRSGAPYRLSPGDLMSATMVTSGTMTNRIDQLEKSGLVERIANPLDGRSWLVALTQKGLVLVEEAVTAHVANQQRLIASMSADERSELDQLLSKFLASFE